MDFGLQEQFNRLETQRQRALAAAASLPETDRVLAMPGSAWSPAQVLTHLVMAEQEFLRRMASTAESGNGGLTPTRSPMLSIFLLLGRYPLFAVPAPDSMIPAADVSLESAARGWEIVRSDLRGWLESVDDPTRTVLCVHPIFGALSAKQALAVMEAHGAYHAKRDIARWERRVGGR